jgi:hypothetical protein
MSDLEIDLLYDHLFDAVEPIIDEHIEEIKTALNEKLHIGNHACDRLLDMYLLQQYDQIKTKQSQLGTIENKEVI